MTASEEHGPERRQDQRRRIAQPAFYGENRTSVRRTDDVTTDGSASDAAGTDAHGSDAQPAPDASGPAAISRQDYDFLTGLISMEPPG